jgi:hypothetical protein
MNDEHHFKEHIEKVLSKHPEGLSIHEISRFVGAHRHTITKYIHELIGSGVIHQRDLGIVKLHYLTKHFNQPEKENEKEKTSSKKLKNSRKLVK